MGGDEHRVGGTRELCLVLRWFAGSGAGQLGKGQAFTGAGPGLHWSRARWLRLLAAGRRGLIFPHGLSTEMIMALASMRR